MRSPCLTPHRTSTLYVTALNLLEKLLELDPKKRISARAALASRYFRVEPIAPSDPAALGSIDLGDGNDGSGYHEFQTKKRRREAKAVAKQAEDEAKRLGEDVERQKEAFDKAYREHLQRGAEKDKQKTVMKEKLEKHKRELEAQDRELQLEMQMFPEQRELDQQKEGLQRMQNHGYPPGQPPYQGGYGNPQSSYDRNSNKYPPRQDHLNARFGPNSSNAPYPQQQRDTGFNQPPNSMEDRRFNGPPYQERPRNPQQQQQPPAFDRRGLQPQQPHFNRGGPGYRSEPNQQQYANAQQPPSSDRMGGEDSRYPSQPSQSYNNRYEPRAHQPPMDQNNGRGPREGNWSAHSDQPFNRNPENERYGPRPTQQALFDQGGPPREGNRYQQNHSFDNRNHRSNEAYGSMQPQPFGRNRRDSSREGQNPFVMPSDDRKTMEGHPQRDYCPTGNRNPMEGSFVNDRRGDSRGRDINRSAYGREQVDSRGGVPSRSEDYKRNSDGMDGREFSRNAPHRQDAFVQRENRSVGGANFATRDLERQTSRKNDGNPPADRTDGDRSRGGSSGRDANGSSYERYTGNSRGDASTHADDYRKGIDAMDSRYAPQRHDAPVQRENDYEHARGDNFAARDQERQSERKNDGNPPSDSLIEAEISLEAAEDMILQAFATGDNHRSRFDGRERSREDSDRRHRHRDRSDESKHRKSHRHSSREHHQSSKHRHRERDNRNKELDQGIDTEVNQTGGNLERSEKAKSVDRDRSSSTKRAANVDDEARGKGSRERSSSDHRKREGDPSYSRDHSRHKRSRYDDSHRDERHRHRSRERYVDRRYENSQRGPDGERNGDDGRSNSYAPPSNQDYDQFGNPMSGGHSRGERDDRRRGDRRDEHR